jgi:hypothetical protein
MGHKEQGVASQIQGWGREYMGSRAGQWEVSITMRPYNCMSAVSQDLKLSICI